MSNINKKNVADNPFRPASQQVSPGLTYGARQQFQKVGQPLTQARQLPRTQDQFEKSKKADTSDFAANATFKAQRRRNVDAYKPKILDNMENGVPRNNEITDEVRLNFLEKVINYTPAKKQVAAPAAKKQFIKA